MYTRPREVAHEVAREVAREVAHEVAREVAREVSCNFTAISREVSGCLRACVCAMHVRHPHVPACVRTCVRDATARATAANFTKKSGVEVHKMYAQRRPKWDLALAVGTDLAPDLAPAPALPVAAPRILRWIG